MSKNNNYEELKHFTLNDNVNIKCPICGEIMEFYYDDNNELQYYCLHCDIEKQKNN